MSSAAASFLLVLLAVAVGFAWYERGRPSSKLVAMVAALAALAVAGRVVFAPIPNVQATTDVVLLSGCALGAAPGFAVGATSALASNFFLGQGPWTPWQMLGWGAVGVAGGLLAPLLVRRGAPGSRTLMTIACAVAGLAFGAWMDLFTLMTFSAERSASAYLAIASVSAPFNIAHAAGNAILCVLFGPGLLRTLLRFRQRFSFEWSGRRRVASSPAGGVAAFALALLVALAAMPDPGQAAARSRAALDGVRYLMRVQDGGGGFGAAPGQPPNQLMSGWAALGLEAAGARSGELRLSVVRTLAFMRSQAGQLTDTGEIERTILAVRGAGWSARDFAGRDLVAELLARQRADGSFTHQVNLTAFGVLALRAAGRRPNTAPVRRAAAWLARQQNADGGFSFAPRGAASDVDDTGAAIQALAAARTGRARVRRAVAFLRARQGFDGGFGQLKGYRSNVQSTAWAVQGIVAAGRRPGAFRRGGSRSPIAFIASLQQRDGGFRYSRTSAQTPVWVTTQAVAALSLKPLPLAAPRRPWGAVITRPARAAQRERAAPTRSGSAPSRRRARSPPAPKRVTADATAAVIPDRPRREGGGGSAWPWIAAIAPAAAVLAFLALRLARSGSLRYGSASPKRGTEQR